MAAADWLNDFPNGSAFFPSIFFGPNLRSSQVRAVYDFPMLGATRDELGRWGYPIRDVPSVDSRIEQCVEASGTAQEACWAGLDQFMMENVVPWIPFYFGTATRVVSPRVAAYSFDEFPGAPALDQIALSPSAIAESS